MIRHAFALLLLATPAAASDPIEGVWRTQANAKGGTGLVQIAPCGTAFCGTVIGDVDAQGRRVPSDIEGRVVLEGIAGSGGTYDTGRVLNPDTGRSYAARLILSGDVLDVGGCVLGICRSGGVWSRVD